MKRILSLLLLTICLVTLPYAALAQDKFTLYGFSAGDVFDQDIENAIGKGYTIGTSWLPEKYEGNTSFTNKSWPSEELEAILKNGGVHEACLDKKVKLGKDDIGLVQLNLDRLFMRGKDPKIVNVGYKPPNRDMPFIDAAYYRAPDGSVKSFLVRFAPPSSNEALTDDMASVMKERYGEPLVPEDKSKNLTGYAAYLRMEANAMGEGIPTVKGVWKKDDEVAWLIGKSLFFLDTTVLDAAYGDVLSVIKQKLNDQEQKKNQESQKRKSMM